MAPLVDEILGRAIAHPAITGHGCPAQLAEAMRYALLAPGKRLRPALVLMAGEACGISPVSVAASVLHPAVAAVEMVHAYSLIHDDLPAMDDDDLRRGRPTVHIRYDEATAILAGDGLLTAAFSCLAEGVADETKLRPCLSLLAMAAGSARLVGGQSDDLAAEADDADLPTDESGRLAHLESIHRRKTGALIAASLGLGGILAGADAMATTHLANYAEDLGLAFQVTDDLLDATGGDASMGKRTGKDADRGKLTYPVLLGVEGARKKADELVESAVRHASLMGDGAWRLRKLARYVLERSH